MSTLQNSRGGGGGGGGVHVYKFEQGDFVRGDIVCIPQKFC